MVGSIIFCTFVLSLIPRAALQNDVSIIKEFLPVDKRISERKETLPPLTTAATATAPTTLRSARSVGFVELHIPDNEDIRTMANEKVETFFVGKDVVKVLGYTNTRKALLDHVEQDDKRDGVTIRDSIGRNQKIIVINESGLYSLILSSFMRICYPHVLNISILKCI